MEKVRPTIKGKLVFDNLSDRAKILFLMRNFRDAIEFAHNLLRKNLDRNKIVKLVTSRILNNAHYSFSAFQRAKLYANQKYLKLHKPQLFSVGKGSEKGNRNIRFISENKVKIKIPHANGRHEWLITNVSFKEKYLPLIRELVDSDFSFSAGIYMKKELELHINVPRTLYQKHFPILTRNKIKRFSNIAVFDLNSDRINMVIVNEHGFLLDIKVKRFSDVTSHGFSENKANDIRRKALKELVEYAVNHGAKTFVAERLTKTNTKTRNKTANRKINKFALRQYIEHLKVLIGRANGKLYLANPAYTSVAAKMISRDLGLDIHTASTYILALRYIKTHKHSPKP